MIVELGKRRLYCQYDWRRRNGEIYIGQRRPLLPSGGKFHFPKTRNLLSQDYAFEEVEYIRSDMVPLSRELTKIFTWEDSERRVAGCLTINSRKAAQYKSSAISNNYVGTRYLVNMESERGNRGNSSWFTMKYQNFALLRRFAPNFGAKFAHVRLRMRT